MMHFPCVPDLTKQKKEADQKYTQEKVCTLHCVITVISSSVSIYEVSQITLLWSKYLFPLMTNWSEPMLAKEH